MTGYKPYGNLIADKRKQEFFQAIAVSLILYGCTTWNNENAWRKIKRRTAQRWSADLSKFLKQHPTKQQLYGHSPLITQTIQIR